MSSKSLHDARTGNEKVFKFPSEMSGRAAPAVRESDAPTPRCTATATCPAQLQGRIESFAKRERMDIEGIGEKLAEQLVASGLVKSVADLYRLKKQQLSAWSAWANCRRRTCSTPSRPARAAAWPRCWRA